MVQRQVPARARVTSRAQAGAIDQANKIRSRGIIMIIKRLICEFKLMAAARALRAARKRKAPGYEQEYLQVKFDKTVLEMLNYDNH